MKSTSQILLCWDDMPCVPTKVIVGSSREHGPAEKHTNIFRPEQPLVGAAVGAGSESGLESAGADGASSSATSEDDDGDGDPDPDGRRRRRRRRKSFRQTLPHLPAPVNPDASKPARLLRLPEIKARTGLSRSTIYQRIKEGSFPPALSIGPRSVAWLESAIDGWIAEQVLNASTKSQ